MDTEQKQSQHGDKMTLIERAKATKKASRGRNSSFLSFDREELLLLALAYANREIDGVQARQALGGEAYTSSVYSALSSALLSAIRRGDLRVERVAKAKED